MDCNAKFTIQTTKQVIHYRIYETLYPTTDIQKYIREYEFSLHLQLKFSIVTHDIMNKPQPTFSYPLET